MEKDTKIDKLKRQKDFLKKCYKVQIVLHPIKDKDIVDYLSACSNKQGLIRELLKKQIREKLIYDV